MDEAKRLSLKRKGGVSSNPSPTVDKQGHCRLNRENKLIAVTMVTSPMPNSEMITKPTIICFK